MQRVLVGRAGSLGTGTIPKDAILETVTARGIADLLDTTKVQHVSGGISTIALKTYLSGREKFQGETLQWVWFDEEPHLRWAWPRDGRRKTLEGAGISLAEQYKEQGLNMLPEHAQFEDGSVSVEAGLMLMLDRMRTGKLKVFKEHNDWWEEFRLYHRKDGKVVKEGDDLLCATRYGLMMLRHASTQSFSNRWNRPIEYPKERYA